MKQCIQCDTEKQEEEFQTCGPHRVKMRLCKTCYQSNRKTGNKSPWSDRDKKFFERYGLDVKSYNELGNKQGNSCLICKKSEKLFVDHCHGSNVVRGLLCNHCNLGLGHFYDNIDLLEQAILYLNNDCFNSLTPSEGLV